MTTTGAEPLIVIASNRGPFTFKTKKDGTFQAKRGAGGLVTALGALAQQYQVMWVAAALSKSDRDWALHHPLQTVQGIDLKLITPNKEDYDRYYNVIANPLLWFIHHGLWEIPRHPLITEATWQAWQGYININRAFAKAIANSIQDETRPVIVLPQDYHLYLVPQFLRELVGDAVQIQPFIHIPWPGPDSWRILPAPMRNAILISLLHANRVGFQTQKDAFNFVQTCRFYLPDAHSHGSRDSIEYKDKRVQARAYPISVDVEKVLAIANENQTQLLQNQLMQYIGGRRLILRVDRIEPSKNILRGLEAYRGLLEKYPAYRGKVQMLALLVPSRMEVDEYQTYLKDIMATAGLINAKFSDELWEPVRIIVGNNYHRAIAAMQISDVLLVNPVADGMNLVAKEGALVNARDGVLLLSEFAGAFFEMGDHALTISPFDIHSTTEAMHRALQMPPAERHARAEALRATVKRNNVRHWFENQIQEEAKP
ncbi:MAG: trehalose-6-phosphate synthase [Anaerolineales bacterium]|nr:trehalose-6-phosphate synthase [Anaerolineales bacterium]